MGSVQRKLYASTEVLSQYYTLKTNTLIGKQKKSSSWRFCLILGMPKCIRQLPFCLRWLQVMDRYEFAFVHHI